MIYLSAQPDQYYFTWQLEIQLFNFHKLGIARENIHILVWYTKTVGLSEEFKNFIKQYENVTSFLYIPTKEKSVNMHLHCTGDE